MAHMHSPEPHALLMERTPTPENSGNIDYSKVPRSSGDGMEHNGTSINEHGNTPRNHTQKGPPQIQFAFNVTNKQTKIHQTIEQNSIHQDLLSIEALNKETLEKGTVSLAAVGKFSLHDYGTPEKWTNDIDLDHSNIRHSSLNSVTNQDKKSKSKLGSPASQAFKSIDNKRSDVLDAIEDLNEQEDSYCMQDAVNSSERTQITLAQLEEQNSKLVDEKTKLVVQLGIQSEVNSDLKKLLVASMGEDLENRLEALVHRNAVLGIEVEHWKNLSQEYAEESDRLAIDCDVWRTKFMASRMMSDQLTCWKTTLYTRYKQAQTALQKMLDERAELQDYLMHTKRLLQSLDYTVKCSAGSFRDDLSLSDKHSSHQQSILEMASISSCLAQDLTTQVQGFLPSASLPTQTLLLTDKAQHVVDPTPAEKLALQCLSSDVELQTSDVSLEESSVMKRMGKQYIGNSYHSRLMTNSFRVTYDCCDRCNGPVHVV